MVTSICADAALNLNIYVDLKNDFTIFVQFQFALNLLHMDGIGILCRCLNYPNQCPRIYCHKSSGFNNTLSFNLKPSTSTMIVHSACHFLGSLTFYSKSLPLLSTTLKVSPMHLTTV